MALIWSSIKRMCIFCSVLLLTNLIEIISLQKPIIFVDTEAVIKPSSTSGTDIGSPTCMITSCGLFALITHTRCILAPALSFHYPSHSLQLCYNLSSVTWSLCLMATRASNIFYMHPKLPSNSSKLMLPKETLQALGRYLFMKTSLQGLGVYLSLFVMAAWSFSELWLKYFISIMCSASLAHLIIHRATASQNGMVRHSWMPSYILAVIVNPSGLCFFILSSSLFEPWLLVLPATLLSSCSMNKKLSFLLTLLTDHGMPSTGTPSIWLKILLQYILSRSPSWRPSR